jgi:cyclopropane fatty-acyl-phospholipid synthase-like methyltransferase
MNKPAFQSASERNKYPILEQLSRILPAQVSVLEIGSGWGQHAMFFTDSMPGWDWQPTEHPNALMELRDQLKDQGGTAIRDPYPLDVLKDIWPAGKYDAVFSANTAHIMSWVEVCAMFAGVGQSLVRGGAFCLYGPFNIDGRFTAPSNEIFDRDLRSRHPDMGIRDMEALESLATSHHMELMERNVMPANNFLLVFRTAE